MKITENVFVTIALCITFYHTVIAGNTNVSIFSDYNTDILLIIDSSNSFMLVGYGGSANGSADCIINAEGKLKGETLKGCLKSVYTDLVSYTVEKKDGLQFSSTLKNSVLTITEANTFGNCGLGTNFLKAYDIVRNEIAIQQKIKNFTGILEGFKENAKLIIILNEQIAQTKTNDNDKCDLNTVYNEAFGCYRNEDKASAAAVIIKFISNKPISYSIISSENVNIYNDIGFFLEQGDKYADAVSVLEEVVKAVPNRTVAYINLGDAYFGLHQPDKAREAYLKYIELMKKEGKEAKIPKCVLERVK
jgi:TolA-binding protein